jgi:hypothetical protein
MIPKLRSIQLNANLDMFKTVDEQAMVCATIPNLMITGALNNHKGSAIASDFNYHVRRL